MNSYSLSFGLSALISLTATTLRAAPLINHALTGTATQSSTSFGGVPERAIDGNTDGHYWNESSSNTGSPAAPDEWWEVDLGGPKDIGRVKLWLRTDCCVSHRTDIRVVIYDTADTATRSVLWMRNLDNPPSDILTFDFSPALTGQVVRVEHVGGIQLPLTLAEVQVFNQASPDLENFARSGVASATTEGFSSTAASAIDGNVSGNFTAPGMYINVTATDPTPAWQLDLSETKAVGRVQVWIRTDNCLPCAKGYRITVLDEGVNILFQGVPDFSPTRSFGFSFGPPLLARFVRVDLDPAIPLGNPPFRILQLAEVEVLGTYPTEPVITVTELPATQTINAGGQATFGPVGAVVDGPVLQEHVSFQWLRNGVDIPGAHSQTYTTPFQSVTNDHDHYSVRVMVPGYAVTSASAELRVLPETQPPLVTNITFFGTTHLNVLLSFDQPITTESATPLANYVPGNGANILAASPGADGHSVVLTVEGLLPSAPYELMVSGVRDLSGNTLMATNLTGTVNFYEINHALAGQASQSSTNHAGYPWLAIDGNTDGVYARGSVTHNRSPETGSWWEVDLGDDKAIGRLVLWWRTDCCLNRPDNFTVRVLDSTRIPVFEQTYPGHPPFPNYAINFNTPLTGRYVRVEGSDPPVGVGNVSLAEVQVIAPYEQNLAIEIATNLPPQRFVLVNSAATFRLGTRVFNAPNNSLTYQWQTNGVDVPGAVGSSYTTPALSFADDGQTVQCRVALPGLTTNSIVSVISISTDDVPPQVEAIHYALGDTPETVKIILQFSETMELWSLGDNFNYSLNDDNAFAAETSADLRSATLTVPTLDASLGLFRLEIENVTDLVGNAIAPVVLNGVFPFTSENLALAGTATQSSTGFGGVPERAIDGNPDPNYWNLSASNTGFPPALNEWWEVDLRSPEPIGQIQIWLRTDCCIEHRRDLRVVAYDQADSVTRRIIWTQDIGDPQPDMLAYHFLPAIIGQVVRVEHFGDLPLPVTLPEVQVFRATAPLKLRLERIGNEIALSWPAGVPNLVLESKSGLDSEPWTIVENDPQFVGDQLVVTILLPMQSGFYRLRRQ